MKSGIDTAFVDSTVRVQDDLFRHLNGTWLKTHEIPDDRASDGVGYKLYEEAEAHVRAIIEGPASGTDSQKISDLYSSFINAERIESLGASPIASYLAKVDQIESCSDFLRTLGELELDGFGGIFAAEISTDHMDSLSNIIYLSQGGLSLPDEAYYREDQYEPIRVAFLDHVTKMFGLIGIENGQEHANRILALETEIARHHWDQVRDRDATLTYNKFTRSELDSLSPGFDWKVWMDGCEMPTSGFETTIVREPDFFTGIGQLLSVFDRESWCSWLKWQVISGAAPYLHDCLVQQNFSFYGTTLSGTVQIRARWKRAVSVVESALGDGVGRIYVERHFPPQAKTEMEALVANLVIAYSESITNLSWMSEPTKKKALEKLAKFTPKIGYPEKWRDYAKLVISPVDLMGNMARIARFARDYELAKIGAPVDRTEWYMTPQTVNAYYNPGMNEIVFPAAILQPPFFDMDADDAVNYGGIGAVIGHEIGHGFDDQGSKYDGDGNLNDWWTQADRDEFEKRANVLIAQYNALAPAEAPDITVNGALTVGENIGDLGGLSIAYKAYKLALKGEPAPVLDGFTGDQRFFLAWAQAWRGKTRPEAVRREIATDPHSPHEFRTNQIVRNMAEFYTAFGVVEGDALYLAPHERVQIW
ncbi:MAG TPA: M13-type metalloendopeptidase [Candidatus Paceibacterota bacterium]|nr:M13-type metalloendopeptidase [Candidatus Paceibacterota bacterium]